MSVKVYFDGFTDLLEAAELSTQKTGPLGQLHMVEDLRSLRKEYKDLVKDSCDWLRDTGQFDLAIKLEAIEAEADTTHMQNTNIELLARLRRSAHAFQTYVPEMLIPPNTVTPPAALPSPTPSEDDADENKVFVVHGHDEALLHQVMRMLGDLGLSGVVLREQVSRSQTIFEKLISHSNVKFAVVLMTADDFGADNEGASTGNYLPRARQNVIMELGFFVGKLERQNVCVLKDPNVEEPSDILGIAYVPIDKGAAWRWTLGKELKASGFDVDLNKL